VLALVSPHVDEAFMRIALSLADSPRACILPNPRVGAVIAANSKIWGSGFHRGPGNPHAEVEAIRDAESKGYRDFSKATLYVTLEPCCHLKKRTPPCAPLVIEKNFSRVVISTKDPNPEVAGKGIKLLKKSGISVDLGCLELEASELNSAFSKNQIQKLPYVILKVAMTYDGKMADDFNSSQWITCDASRSIVQEIRARADAIAIGARTFDVDNPSLNTRLPGETLKRKIILFGNPKRRISTSKAAKSNGAESILTLRSKTPLRAQIRQLYLKQNVHSILVEGGAKLASSFLASKLVDEVILFYGRGFLGGRGTHGFFQTPMKASLSKMIPLRVVETKLINEQDVMIRGFTNVHRTH